MFFGPTKYTVTSAATCPGCGNKFGCSGKPFWFPISAKDYSCGNYL